MSGRFRQQAVALAILSLFTQIVGIGRVSVLAASFGTSVQYGAFSVVTSVAVFAFGFVSAAIAVVLIPTFMQTAADRAANTIQTAMFVVIAATVSLIWLARYPILSYLSFGDAAVLAATLDLLLVVIFGQALVAVTSVLTAYLQCRGNFNVPKIMTLLSTATLLVLIVVEPRLTIDRYALYLVFTNGLNAALQLGWAVRIGYRYRPQFSWRDQDFRARMGGFAPIAISASFYQATLIIDTAIASSLGVDKVAVLAYAMSIVAIVSAVISSNLVTLIYPKMSVDVVTDRDAARAALPRTCLQFAAVVAAAVVLFLAAGRSGIEILFERGAFDAEDTWFVFISASILLAGLPMDIVRDTMYRFFYAAGNVRAPLYNSLIASTVNVAVSLVLSRYIGLYGVVLGTTLAGLASLVMIQKRFELTFGKPKQSADRMRLEVPKIVLSGGFAVLLSYGVGTILVLPALGYLIVSSGITLFFYLVFLRMLRSAAFRPRPESSSSA